MDRASIIKRLRVLERSKHASEARLAKEAADMLERDGVFDEWRRRDDPESINPQILAARGLGIQYGDPGPKLPYHYCRRCWGERFVWLGNTWGVLHVRSNLLSCNCPCHSDEVWMAGAAIAPVASALPALEGQTGPRARNIPASS